MKRLGTYLAGSTLALLVLPLTSFSFVAMSAAGPRPDDSARDAISANESVARPACARLRAMGPAGMDALLGAQRDEIQRMRAALPAGVPDTPAWKRLREALDAVSRQRDAYRSGLYWFTDLEAAKRYATETDRPILSLRLLGNLDEELSCANSRYFRTALYASQDISEALRSGWVLHWQSVRPVPKVEIDFGDGRRIERTITGNSLHYVLAPDGRVLDVLPGLYGPGAFKREIERAALLSRDVARTAGADRDELLARRHRERLAELVTEWAADLAATGSAPATSPVGWDDLPTLRARLDDLEVRTEADAWTAHASRHRADAVLDDDSRELMRAKTLGVYSDRSFARVVARFEDAAALDTLRNERLLRRVIHEWFAARTVPADLPALTDRIYAKLFLTPMNDPWLGLVPAETYAALDGDGRGARGVAATDEQILRSGPQPSAVAAGRLATSKMLLETRIVQQVIPLAPDRVARVRR